MEGFQWFSSFLHDNLYQHKRSQLKVQNNHLAENRPKKTKGGFSKQNHFINNSLLPFLTFEWNFTGFSLFITL